MSDVYIPASKGCPSNLRTGIRRYDTVGLFGRSLRDITFMATHSLQTSQPDAKKPLPTRILYPTDFFPLADPEQQSLYESFVQKLETLLRVKRIEVDLAQLWKDQPPSESSAADVPLQEYMKRVSLAFPTRLSPGLVDNLLGTLLVTLL